MVTFLRMKKSGNQTRFSCLCILLQRLSAAYSEKHKLYTSSTVFQITPTHLSLTEKRLYTSYIIHKWPLMEETANSRIFGHSIQNLNFRQAFKKHLSFPFYSFFRRKNFVFNKYSNLYTLFTKNCILRQWPLTCHLSPAILSIDKIAVLFKYDN